MERNQVSLDITTYENIMKKNREIRIFTDKHTTRPIATIHGPGFTHVEKQVVPKEATEELVSYLTGVEVEIEKEPDNKEIQEEIERLKSQYEGLRKDCQLLERHYKEKTKILDEIKNTPDHSVLVVLLVLFLIGVGLGIFF